MPVLQPGAEGLEDCSNTRQHAARAAGKEALGATWRHEDPPTRRGVGRALLGKAFFLGLLIICLAATCLQVMVVTLGDAVHRIAVKPGPDGMREFQQRIRTLFAIPDGTEFEVSVSSAVISMCRVHFRPSDVTCCCNL